MNITQPKLFQITATLSIHGRQLGKIGGPQNAVPCLRYTSTGAHTKGDPNHRANKALMHSQHYQH